MRDNLTIHRMIEFLTILIVPMFVYAYYTGSAINNYVIYLVYMLIVLLAVYNNGMRLYFHYRMRSIYIGLLIAVFVLPMVFFHITSLTGALYVVLLILFLLTVDIISQQLVGSMGRVITWWAILGTVLVDANIIRHISDINSNTLTAIFYTTESAGYRYRAYFGFQHPNSIAAILVGMVILYYWLLRNKRDMRFLQKVILIALIAFHFVCLCCTGSRTAAIALLLFFATELFLWLLTVFASRYRAIWCVFILIIVVSVLFTSGIDFSFFAENSSGRYETFTSEYSSLIESGGFFIGTIVTNISGSSSVYGEIGLSGTDSWYYTFLLKFGMVGVIIFLIPVLSLFISEFKTAMEHGSRTFAVSAMLMLLVYGVTENIFFNQGVMLSFVVWVLFIENMYANDELEDESPVVPYVE